MATLLPRDEFRRTVLALFGGRCCVPECPHPAEDAHHIIERRLWPDGGYYVANGAPLCDRNGTGHHRDAELNEITPEELRQWCGHETVTPPSFMPDAVYDKWGLMKYPRTFHLPGSPGMTSDDKQMPDTSALREAAPLVATEKMDGENTTMMRDRIYARSLDSPSHRSQDWVRNLWASIKWEIPEGWRLCGENVYAEHSIKYVNLPSYFLLFGVFDEAHTLLSWKDTFDIADVLGLHVVRPLAAGSLDEILATCVPYDETVQEGFVVRPCAEVPIAQFHNLVGKYVRANHVRTAQHGWRYRNDFAVNALAR